MEARYKYGRRPGRKRRTRIAIVLAISLLIVGSVGGIVALDMLRSKGGEVRGTSLTVLQTNDESPNKLTINEPTFTMELPGDWKEAERQNTATQHMISWRATKKAEDNRYLVLYVDTIPATKSINNLLPLTVQGSKLVPGDVSENCANFTLGGSLKTNEIRGSKDTPARWQGVDFICDLPRPTDREIGTGSPGAINTTTVAGPQKGPHKYFFLYVDHNIQPNNSIFVNALQSFVAK